jgi:hypothetical protein
MKASSMRRFWTVLGLMVMAWPAAASAPSCARLFIPEQLHLICRAEQGPGIGDWRLVVEPANGAVAMLTHLEVRHVDEPVDDPAAWLQDQVRLGLHEVRASLQHLLDSSDNPIAGSRLNKSIKDWIQRSDYIDDIPLSGCQEPEPHGGPNGWQMACRWGIGDVESQLILRLDGPAEERHLMTIRAMTERRLRHLLAIANSF